MTETIAKNAVLFNLDKYKLHESLLKIKFEFKDTEEIRLVNKEEYNKLISIKNLIDKLDDGKLWDKMKKISNDYELIYLPNKKLKNFSISKYEPLSRSYFKLWEIIHDYNLINVNENIKTAGLAEGPGGFIEAMVNFRKKYKYICKNDDIYGITLKSIDKDIPGWNKATHFLRKNRHVNISYGSDGTGNLYKLDNILAFATHFKNDVNLVTADGGFDFSTNFNKQEQSSLRIIFCEIVTALSIQKKGGSFVCKIYDSYTEVSISYLFLLNILYDKVYITKPVTSRPANSEKYIVCKGFKGISDILLRKLHIVVKSWEYVADKNKYIYQILNFDVIPNDFIEVVRNFNTNFFTTQSKNILKTLTFIKSFSDSKDNENTDMYKLIVKKQVQLAFNWCKRYKCKINYESEHLTQSRNNNCNTGINKKIKVI